MRLRADSASGYRFAAIATLAAAVAGITLLAGIVQLRLPDLATRPLLAPNPIPHATWPQRWLESMRSAELLQNTAVAEWLNVVLALLLTIVIMAGVSALIALFAHASARRYEVALRAVVGATRARIRAEQLTKAAVNVAIAVAVGVSIGLIAAVGAHRAWPHQKLGAIAGEWVLVSMAFAAITAALVARTAARRMATAGWMGDVLAPEARSNPGYGAEDLRAALLQLQFAFTFAVLAAGLLVWQHARTRAQVSAGAASTAYVARGTLAEHASGAQRQAILRLLAQRGVRVATPGTLIGVGATDHVLSDCGPCSANMMPLPMFAMRTQHHVVSEGFFDTIGAVVRVGREFEPDDARAHNIVVNDTFATLAFQGQHPIGKRILVGGLRGDWYTVIGVVRDLPIAGLVSYRPDDRTLVDSNIPGQEPAIYFYAGERPPGVVDIVARAPRDLQLAGVTIGPWKTVSAVRASARAPAGWFAGLLSALAAAAAAIAVLSLGALTLLNVRQRELEIAARRSVGARRRDIIGLIVSNTVATAGRGMLAGIVISVALARAIQMVLPDMRIFDLRVIAICAAVLSIAALIAAIIPARAAARVMPAQIHA
ncbi:MAG TPA: FtsX-like permease family protein [Longimicrobiales bacterium]